MSLISRFFNLVNRIDDFIFYFIKSIISVTPPFPESIKKLISENYDMLQESSPDINTINENLMKSINNHERYKEEKLLEKANHILNVSSLSIHNLRSILYDSEKILDVKIINWLQLRNKLFIVELTCEIPVVYAEYKTFKIKKYYYISNLDTIFFSS